MKTAYSARPLTALVAAAAFSLLLAAGVHPARMQAGAVAVASARPDAEPAASGKSLVVPDKLAKAGTVYHAMPGKDKQISFTSKASETIEGQSNRVIGFAVAGPTDSPAALKGGEWHLPVDSLRTGNPAQEKHLAGADWLDAPKNPNIVFRITEVKEVKAGAADDKSKSYTATLVGKMSLHGVTKDLTIPNSTITFRKASAETAKTAKGDLMLIHSRFPVKLSDYGVKNNTIGKKVAEEIKLDVTFYLSTVPPEQQS